METAPPTVGEAPSEYSGTEVPVRESSGARPSSERQAAPVDVARLRRLMEEGTAGPWLHGQWHGHCRLPEHGRMGHPGPPECKYDYELKADNAYDRCYISAPVENVELIGSNDYGPILNEADAALIVAMHEALPELLERIEELEEALRKTLPSLLNNDPHTAMVLYERIRSLLGAPGSSVEAKIEP